MKKLTIFLVSVLAMMIICQLMGCSCPTSGCQKDLKIAKSYLELFPFQLDDNVRYVSDASDTITFKCSSIEIDKEGREQEGAVEQECCENYTVEKLHLLLETPLKDSLSIMVGYNLGFHHNISGRVIVNNSKIVGGWVGSDYPGQFPGPEYLDSIQLAGKTFYNAFHASNGEKIYFSFSLGVVGFIVDGKEWRLLY